VKQDRIPVRDATVGAAQRVGDFARKFPPLARILLGLFLAAAVLMAIHTSLSAKTSSLKLRVQHSFRSAQLSVYVDDELTWTTGMNGSSRRRFGLFSDVVQGSVSKTIPVSSGTHAIRVRVLSGTGTSLEESIRGKFPGDGDRKLSVVARSSSVTLAWQDGTGGIAEPGTMFGWFGGYAASLFLTVVGSLISALAAFAVQELPKWYASRRVELAKARSASAGQ
jgi:hypothetical protein